MNYGYIHGSCHAEIGQLGNAIGVYETVATGDVTK